jgi:two-component sensor histidine kinase
MQCYLKSLVLHKESHDYEDQLRLIGYIQNQSVPFRERYVNEAVNLANRFPIPSQRWHVYLARGNFFAQADRPDSALAYYRKVLISTAANRQWENHYGHMAGYGYILDQMGRYQEAEQTFRRALAYGIRQHNNRRVLYEYINLMQPLMHQNRFGEAEQYAQLALERIKTDPERRSSHRMAVYDMLTQIAEAKGQYRQALDYHRQYVVHQDSVTRTERTREVAELETRYRTAEQQVRINRLDQDNRQQLRRSGWLGGGLLLLTTLLGVVLWQYRTIRRVNARLVTTSQTVAENHRQMSEQAEKLTVLMRELNHRVKNNLAIVSSLLRLQSKRLTDEQAIRAVQDGQHRVEALSLIHQRLYQTDSVNQVAIRPYVAELTEGLLLSYGFDPAHFDCRVEVVDIELDVEVAVPLGLILNEVLTNAFKYAYGQVKKPALSVRLQPNDTGRGLLLEVQDNGPGLSSPGLEGPGLDSSGLDSSGLEGPVAPRRSGSFGQRLIAALTEQLGGQMELTNRKGAYFRFTLPDVGQVPVTSA